MSSPERSVRGLKAVAKVVGWDTINLANAPLQRLQQVNGKRKRRTHLPLYGGHSSSQLPAPCDDLERTVGQGRGWPLRKAHPCKSDSTDEVLHFEQLHEANGGAEYTSSP